MSMNEIEAYQVCNSAISALSHGETSLSTFPKLLRRIINERAWESRRVPGKGVVTMQSLRELVTTAPITGWGEDPAKIEAVIRDDAEVLAMWREAMKGKPGRPKQEGETRRNPTQFKTADRGRAYDLSRLQREAPELFAKVAAGEMSANAAAIKAGFRKRKSPLEKAVAAVDELCTIQNQDVRRGALVEVATLALIKAGSIVDGIRNIGAVRREVDLLLRAVAEEVLRDE